MDQNKKHGKKCPVLKKIKNFLTSQIRLDARLLEFMQDHPEITPDSDPIEAPPGEFEKIMAEMNARGIKPAIRRELAVRKYFKQAERYMQRPAFVALLVVLILGGTSAGVSAKKAYDYRMREREVGKSDIVWNNDEYVLTEDDGLDSAYLEIERQLSVEPLKFMFLPFKTVFKELKIYSDHANIKFIYNDKAINCVQSKKPVTSSNNVVSDRSQYKEIHNYWLDIFIPIEKNELTKDVVEYSAKFNLHGCYYYISGVISEEEFIKIVENLAY